MRRALTMAALAMSMLPAALGAQRVRGTLHDSASTLPLTGAVVALLDSSGTVTARTVADGTGAFSLPLTPRAARLHVIRIGYRPRDVALPANRPGGGVLLSLSLSRIPPVLATVRVSGAELCPGSTDRGSAFQLWDQARAGLLATVVARETNPADIAAIVYQRYVRLHDELITREIIGSRGGRMSRPFVSARKPGDFAEHGYIEEDSTSARTYNAPDEEVLLDESFAATHCFHLQPPDAAHTGQIGLAFTPLAGRDTIVDVSGVVWMDATSPALRALDFRYTNLEPAALSADAGGHVEFRSLSNGMSFIEWWNLRLPMFARTELPARAAPAFVERRARRDRSDYRVDQLLETGGQVLRARWNDNTTWEAHTSGVTGAVTQRGSTAPVPYAVVALAGTSDTVMADAQGRFEISPVPAGRYTLTARDTSLSGYLPDRLVSQAVSIPRDSLVPVAAELQSSARMIEALCKDQRARGTPSVIVGHIQAEHVNGIEVRATWNSLIGQSGGGVAVEAARQESTVDDRGHFIICAPGRGQAIQLRAVRAGVSSDTTIVTNESSLTRVDWTLPAPPAVKPPERSTRNALSTITALTERAAPAPDRSAERAAPASDTRPRRPRATATRPRRT